MGLLLAAAATLLAGPATAQTTSAGVPCVKPAGGATTFPGGQLTLCTVPAGVTQVKGDLWGAQGGDNKHTSRRDEKGGAGGYATRTFPVTPGASLLVFPGTLGNSAGVLDAGGGGGGGASGVYTFYPPAGAQDMIVVAGGGGGAGCDDGGWGGGIKGLSENGTGRPAYTDSDCSGRGNDAFGQGGGGGTGGAGGFGEAGLYGGNGFGGQGGYTEYGGAGGLGPAAKGNGGLAGNSSSTNHGGGGGGGGFGGGGGGRGGGGGGGGSFPASAGPPDFGNGGVSLSVPGKGTDPNGCALPGTPFADVLTATPQPEKICGYSADDLLFGDEGRDRLVGGRGDDVLRGGRGPDHLSGGPGFDVCKGNRGHDVADSSCEGVIGAVRG